MLAWNVGLNYPPCACWNRNLCFWSIKLGSAVVLHDHKGEPDTAMEAGIERSMLCPSIGIWVSLRWPRRAVDGRDPLNIPKYERPTTRLPADQLKDWRQNNVLFPLGCTHRAEGLMLVFIQPWEDKQSGSWGLWNQSCDPFHTDTKLGVQQGSGKKEAAVSFWVCVAS